MNDAIRLIGVDKYFKFGRSHKTLFSFFKKQLNEAYYPAHLLSALKNISFQIKKGEKIGLIGNNGAGKTTLLRIIGGLHKTTNGKVITNGDIVMLSGHGTGMVSELTVKENLYLYGAIYRINRPSIRAKLDDILARMRRW